MICHKSGRDDDLRLKRTRADEPKLESKPKPPPPKLTKKEQKHLLRLYGKELDDETRRWFAAHCA